MLKLKSGFDKKYIQGYPLILKETLQNCNNLTEGDVINLYSSMGKFIGTGYIGFQNKGIGWILSYSKNFTPNKLFFEDKINIAFKKRKIFFNDTKTTAFRLFNGEGDGIGGITIDYYNGNILINWYSIGIYKFKNFIYNAIKSKGFTKSIYEKKRVLKNGQVTNDTSFVYGKKLNSTSIIKESGVNVAINLDNGAMTGIFLDQRNVRKKLMESYSQNKTVLNTFSYTGLFSVFAAIGKAKQTVSVDLAKRSIALTKQNFEINNITLKNNKIIVMDVFDYIKFALKKGIKFDTIILDPPSYAKSKKNKFTASQNYTSLLKSVIPLLNKNGIIIASTNCSKFDKNKFKSFVYSAFASLNINFEIINEFYLPKDFCINKNFPQGNYLKVFIIKTTK